VFARVDDAEEALTRAGNDLLAGEGAATALDECALIRVLVRTVDVERQIAGVVELDHGYAPRPQALGRGLGARHRSLDPGRHLAQPIDEVSHRGAGAHADDHIVVDGFEGGAGSASFVLVVGHRVVSGRRSASV
jgi:recombinational DNA repair protein (RecF pathway)